MINVYYLYNKHMKYVPEYKEYLDGQLLGLPNVEPGKMFGYPAYYVNGKLAVCHYEDNLIIKLPAEQVTLLVDSDVNASREGPKPRKNMGKQWVFLHVPNINSLHTYLPLCQQSVTFVKSISNIT